MHVLFVTQGVPNYRTAGGALTAWGIMVGLLEKSIKVTVVVLPSKYSNYSEKNDVFEKKCIDECINKGAEIIVFQREAVLDKKQINLVDLLSGYHHSKLFPEIQNLIKRLKPNAVLCYHFEGLAATFSLKNIPKMALVGDPTHLPIWLNWINTPFNFTRNYFVSALIALRAVLVHPFTMVKMLNSCDATGAFAAHHARWFLNKGVKNCEYFRTPMIDEVGDDWREKRDKYRLKQKTKILMMGHLKGTATRLGIKLFINEVMPVLEREHATGGLEIHIIGTFFETLPKSWQKSLEKPYIKIRGYVDSIEDELLSSDALLVPTPVKLGIRVRIITGFSYGCCIIAHEANTFGIPEMVNNKNAIVGKNGYELAMGIINIMKNKSFQRKLENSSRETFEKYFSIPKAGGRIVDKLIEITS